MRWSAARRPPAIAHAASRGVAIAGGAVIVATALLFAVLLALVAGCGGSSKVNKTGGYTPNYAADILSAGGNLQHYETPVIKFAVTRGGNAVIDDIVKKGGMSWTSALNSQGYSIEYSTDNPQIQVECVSNADLQTAIIAAGHWAPSAIGLSYANVDPATGYIVSSVSMLDESIWNQIANGKNLAVHEIGHALGLGGHSKDKRDALYKDVPLAVYSEPTESDNNTMSGTYAGYFNQPAAPKAEGVAAAPATIQVVLAIDEK